MLLGSLFASSRTEMLESRAFEPGFSTIDPLIGCVIVARDGRRGSAARDTFPLHLEATYRHPSGVLVALLIDDREPHIE
ncbi:hypothetical protein KDW20_32455 [Burkholderia cenocepacia]|uniref:hypothetical protein n=1 Tax=Burkholderia cenocepacia TaxID=95486 RepID=UPI00158F3A2F|nr:hypothetical protein [Burkholderia cenocepacia]MBR8380495.1 hypothetical protein [Burkholderia cenocepacia]MBR8415057.1 hypothetical protein [Burkholderia cenocepacia]MCA8238978.1 hypothetical protein [Burkholderia cenocepacia]MDS0849641.1 hypothetical protein [Burkholderia cenocepacia]